MVPKVDQFSKYVYPEPNTGCWIWAGAQDYDGYGICSTHYINQKKYTRAHRASFAIHKGNFDSKLLVCHTCDNPNCVNPDHLFLGTHLDNIRDCKRKNRRHTGAKHSKLTTSQVLAIRHQHENELCTHKDLGKEYGVSRSNIGVILSRKIWSHI